MHKFNRNDSVGFLLQRAAKELAQHASHVLQSKGFDLNIEHLRILARLWEEDKLTQQELGERMCQDKTNITRAIDFLEEKGYVKRLAGLNDRRNKYIQLTLKGKKMEQKFVPIVANEILGVALKGFSKDEIELFKKMLNTVYNNLQKVNN
ncbi:MAG: MarR family winged helix-turn-helix transcriptional regulator [Bacteroidia bacterium]